MAFLRKNVTFPEFLYPKRARARARDPEFLESIKKDCEAQVARFFTPLKSWGVRTTASWPYPSHPSTLLYLTVARPNVIPDAPVFEHVAA